MGHDVHCKVGSGHLPSDIRGNLFFVGLVFLPLCGSTVGDPLSSIGGYFIPSFYFYFYFFENLIQVIYFTIVGLIQDRTLCGMHDSVQEREAILFGNMVRLNFHQVKKLRKLEVGNLTAEISIAFYIRDVSLVFQFEMRKLYKRT